MDEVVEKHIRTIMDELKEKEEAARRVIVHRRTVIQQSEDDIHEMMAVIEGVEVLRNALEAQKEAPKSLCNDEMGASEVLCNILDEMKDIITTCCMGNEQPLLLLKVQQCVEIVKKENDYAAR